MEPLVALCVAALVALNALTLRAAVLLPCMRGTPDVNQKLRHNSSATLMVFLGSGGHTGEMLRMLESLQLHLYSHRYYIYSSGDATSREKAESFEKARKKSGSSESSESSSTNTYAFREVIRARKVGQSWVTTVLSTIASLISCFRVALLSPDVVVCNGPGTAVPLCYLLFLLKVVGLNNTRIIYVESLARVESLSLSGKLLLPISNRFVVQWEQLKRRYGRRVEYYGILV